MNTQIRISAQIEFKHARMWLVDMFGSTDGGQLNRIDGLLTKERVPSFILTHRGKFSFAFQQRHVRNKLAMVASEIESGGFLLLLAEPFDDQCAEMFETAILSTFDEQHFVVERVDAVEFETEPIGIRAMVADLFLKTLQEGRTLFDV